MPILWLSFFLIVATVRNKCGTTLILACYPLDHQVHFQLLALILRAKITTKKKKSQYIDNQLYENGSKANSPNTICIKYASAP